MSRPPAKLPKDPAPADTALFSRYKLELPPKEELRKLLLEWRQEVEEDQT